MINTFDPVLVVGATGTLGGAVVTELLERGIPVRALVRGHRRPGLPGVDQRVGDLTDPDTVAAALGGVRTAFYVPPHEEGELGLAQTFVAAAERAGVRIVFAGVHVAGTTLRGRLRRVLFSRLMPAYGAKLRIGALIERRATAAVLLAPTCFYENDDYFAADLAAGVLPSPMRQVNRVAVHDIAVIAADALTDPGFAAGTYVIVGPRSWSTAECAAVWTAASGRPVRDGSTDPEVWPAALHRAVPAGKKRADFTATYTALGRLRLDATKADLATTTRLLGRAPLGYQEWVAARASATSATMDGCLTPRP